MSPAFRELNYAKIKKLTERYSDATIASMVSDKTGETVTPSDIASYLKMNGIASRVMLVTKGAMEFASNEPRTA
ncbi:hypothetical protein FHT00_003366 [Sphingomonas insulae]|nr:hypothetical protein [Sphingomonas insulae]NIJ31386.1 hypothetical protein [Sphingomonas insulae]